MMLPSQMESPVRQMTRVRDEGIAPNPALRLGSPKVRTICVSYQTGRLWVNYVPAVMRLATELEIWVAALWTSWAPWL